MARLSLFLFGTYQIAMDGNTHSQAISAKGRALLAYLAIEGQPQLREKIAGLLWPEHSEAQARQNLSQVLHTLRGLLPSAGDQPPLLRITAQHIQLNPDADVWVDVAEFLVLLEACDPCDQPRQATCQECPERLRRAAALYRGSFLSDFSLKDVIQFEEWCTVTRERLHRQAMHALGLLTGCLEAHGEVEQALEIARRLVELDPLNEGGHRQVMRLLAESGRRSAALSHFQAFQRYMLDTLGVPPDVETLEQYEKIINQVPQPDKIRASEVRLPTSLTPFIGRHSEARELSALLRDPACRLVTILGPGGVGKTRLALEVALGLGDDFSQGVYFISLSAYQPGNPLWSLLAEALRFQVREKGDPEQQVLDYLRTKHALLIFDSFETALEKVAWLAELLQYAPRLTALVTSRACLETSDEQVFTLGGMSFPRAGEVEQAEQFEAVQLFTSFIRRRQPAFILDDHSRTGITRICRLVQGFPLGLLLASAWVDLYSLDEIAGEIESNQDFLKVNWRDLPARQRSLRAAFDYSWKLLEKGEQAIFRALCVFRGGFTRQAAEKVGGANPQELRQLVDKSLVMPQAGEWYAIHALLRQYGLERLNDLPTVSIEVHQRYSAYYLEKLEQWEAGLKGAHQAETLTTLDSKITDLRPAWDWACQQGEIDRLSRGLEGLCLYYELSARFREGQSACQAAVDGLAGVDTPQACSLQAHLRIWQSRFSRLLGELEPARRHWEESLELASRLASFGQDARRLQAFIWLEAGEAIFTNDLKVARQHLQRSVELYRQAGDTWRLAVALVDLGINLQHSGDFAQATELMMECIAICRATGDQRGLAHALTWLAFNFSRIGSLEKCVSLIRESMAINQSIGDKASMADGLMWMGRLMIWQGQFEESFGLLEQCLPLYNDLGDRYNSTFVYAILGLGSMLGGKYGQVEHYSQIAIELAQENGLGREMALSYFVLGGTALAEGETQEAYKLMQESVNLYRQVGHQDELGWALAVLADIQTVMGQPEGAKIALNEALQIAVKTRAQYTLKHTLAAMTLILAREGRARQAVELYTLVLDDPVWKGSPWMEKVVGQYVTAASASLPEDVAEATRQRGRQRDLVATAQELLEEYTAGVGTSRILKD